VLSARAVPRSYKEGTTIGATRSVLYGSLLRKVTVGRKLPFRLDLSVEAEESPLLEAVTREQLLKTQQAGKELAGAVVI
jgi:hypothetical protein